MAMMDWAAWSVIAGLSFLSIGGLLIWAYGDSMSAKTQQVGIQEIAGSPRRSFMGVIVYGIALILIGLGCLVQGTFFILG